MMNNRNKVRSNVINAFIEAYKPLFDQQPLNFCHQDYKSESGRKIIRLVRTKIGYSPKTCDTDLYWVIMNKYKKLYKS